METEKIYLNQSRISEVLDCEQQYYWEYEHEALHGIRVKTEKLPLVTGRCYHTGISYYYHHDRDIRGAIDAAVAEFKQVTEKVRPMGDENKLWEQDALTLAVLLQGYHARWQHEPLTVLAPECTGSVLVGTITVQGKSIEVYFVFRTDALCSEYKTICLLEHKTKGRTPSANEIAATHNALQPTSYCYGTSKLTGMKVQGVKYRFAIKKPDYEVRRMHTEAFTSRTDKDLARFEEETLWVASKIMQRRLDGQWLHSWNHCYRYSECPYRRLCLYHGEEAMFSLYEPRKHDYVDEATEKGGLIGTKLHSRIV